MTQDAQDTARRLEAIIDSAVGCVFRRTPLGDFAQGTGAGFRTRGAGENPGCRGAELGAAPVTRRVGHPGRL